MRLVALVVVVLVHAFALAAPRAEAAEAPTYTNADLEKFGPAPPPPAGPLVVTDEGWNEVQRFLDREYAKIESERRYALELKESDRRDVAVGAYALRRDGYWMAPGLYWPWGFGSAGFPDCAGVAGCGVPFGSGALGGRPSLYPGSTGKTGFERQRAFLSRRETIHAAPRASHPHGSGSPSSRPQGAHPRASAARAAHSRGRGHAAARP